jgi:hypothetical protein
MEKRKTTTLEVTREHLNIIKHLAIEKNIKIRDMGEIIINEYLKNIKDISFEVIDK